MNSQIYHKILNATIDPGMKSKKSFSDLNSVYVPFLNERDGLGKLNVDSTSISGVSSHRKLKPVQSGKRATLRIPSNSKRAFSVLGAISGGQTKNMKSI